MGGFRWPYAQPPYGAPSQPAEEGHSTHSTVRVSRVSILAWMVVSLLFATSFAMAHKWAGFVALVAMALSMGLTLHPKRGSE